MAGAYAALVSLTTVIDSIRNHPDRPISLNTQLLEALVERVAFLQEYLEVYSHSEAADGLASLIRDAAYAAEDAIEFCLVDEISRSKSFNHVDLRFDLVSLLRHMDSIKDSIEQQAIMEIKEKMGDVEDHQHISSISNAPPVPPSTGKKAIMVGFDDVLNDILDKLVGQQSSRQIIPIVGMGGIGKTTLASKAYEHALVTHRFDIRIWITVSQKYKKKVILIEILRLCQRYQHSEEGLIYLSEEQLGEKIHKIFYSRKYLIVMDDMWSIDAWDEIKLFFPENKNGSRMIITTRISSVASRLTGSSGVQLDFLDENESWNLLCKTVFREDDCPQELEETGKIIAKNCKGLPLSIVVIGGLLAKSKQTKQDWENIARNLNSIVNEEEGDRSFKILHMSYMQLPMYLKPCFLYMGVYREDATICVSWLVKLLVAEGFLKPIGGKILEDVAEEYLKDLADRNLILIEQWGTTGGIKYCKIHDVLRDLCIREAKKEEFLYILGEHEFGLGENKSARRIAAHRRTMWEYPDHAIDALHSTSFARSFVGNFAGELPSFSSRLLRILKVVDDAYGFKDDMTKITSMMDHFGLYNMRYLTIASYDALTRRFASSFSFLWNLQTLIVKNHSMEATAPVEIWKMTQLRHVKFIRLHLPNPPDDNLILWNLQTLSWIIGFKCGDVVVKRIPNIKKLEIEYPSCEDYLDYCLNNIQYLHKLEHLHCSFIAEESKTYSSNSQLKLALPPSLKKLVIGGKKLRWEDVTTMIGSLPNLEKLKLVNISGSEWEPLEEQFLSLKHLELRHCRDLKSWTADSTHFPLLKHLRVVHSPNLAEVPFDIANIPTLESVSLHFCNDSVVKSAKRMAEEQKEFGNSDLIFYVCINRERKELESLASHNFRVYRDW